MKHNHVVPMKLEVVQSLYEIINIIQKIRNQDDKASTFDTFSKLMQQGGYVGPRFAINFFQLDGDVPYDRQPTGWLYLMP